MARRGKQIREKGKLKLSSYFKKIDDGTRVALVADAGIRTSFSKRLQGVSGKVITSRGKFKEVEIKDGNKLKTLVVHPIHLKKL
jgi:large subunit ribosomal protein L21e